MKYQIHTKGKFVRFSTKPSQALAAYEDKNGRSCIDIYPVDDITNSYLKIWFNNDSLHIIAFDTRNVLPILCLKSIRRVKSRNVIKYSLHSCDDKCRNWESAETGNK